MKRHRIAPRSDWPAKADSIGFTYHALLNDIYGGVYWDESAAYEFTAAEVDVIEAATETLSDLCTAAVCHVLEYPGLMARFGIPPAAFDYVRQSSRRADPKLYGRMDLAFDPENSQIAQPKLLEYNADTPTTLIESAVMQWFWLKERFPDADQFNSIHERLIERWREISERMARGVPLHLTAWAESEEETRTVEYLADTARQAGIDVRLIAIEQIGWDPAKRVFVDTDGQRIRFLFKLYPWEWLLKEEFGSRLLHDTVGLIEPPWKMILSNKAILPVLWQLFPDHPNLLPAYFDAPRSGEGWVAKPTLGREGANILLRFDGEAHGYGTAGDYGDQPLIYQRAVNTRRPADDTHVTIGSWLVGDKACGMIIREDTHPIITGKSRVIPHFFR